MSTDPHQNAPVGHAAPAKKSGALKWILGGLGCFGLLGLLCFGGVAYMGYQGVQMVTGNAAYLEARATLESSASLGDTFGNPITVGEPTDIQTNQQGSDAMELVYQIPVSGPNGSGTAEVQVQGKPFAPGEWTLESLTVVDADGNAVPLDGGGLEVNIEGE